MTTAKPSCHLGSSAILLPLVVAAIGWFPILALVTASGLSPAPSLEPQALPFLAVMALIAASPAVPVSLLASQWIERDPRARIWRCFRVWARGFIYPLLALQVVLQGAGVACAYRDLTAPIQQGGPVRPVAISDVLAHVVGWRSALILASVIVIGLAGAGAFRSVVVDSGIGRDPEKACK